MKKYILAGTFALALASCSDSFLEEKMVSSITQDYLNTEIGLDQLIVSSYNSVRFPMSPEGDHSDIANLFNDVAPLFIAQS